MGKGWQAEVRRYGHKVYRTFPTREEAERYAEAIEEEMLRAQQLADAFNNRYSFCRGLAIRLSRVTPDELWRRA